MVQVGKLLGFDLSSNTYILGVDANQWALRVQTRLDFEDEYDAARFLAVISKNPELIKGSFVDQIDEPLFQNVQADESLETAVF
eukprot:scaffold321822_cov43-Prasinocladus_malaysianus.AAC.1